MPLATLRLLPAPDCGPPYDDELPPVVLPTAPLRLQATPLRLVPETLDPLGEAEGADDGRGPRTPLDLLPDPDPFVRALVQRLLEVQAGLRPLRQLENDTSPELYERLEHTLQGRTEGGRLRSSRLQVQPTGVVEALATVVRRTAHGPRVQALALRLEGRAGRWCCTDVEGLGPAGPARSAPLQRAARA